MLDVDIRRIQRQQPVHENFALGWRQDADLLQVRNIAATGNVEALLLHVAVHARTTRRLGVTDQVFLVLGQALQPVECAVDFRIAEPGARQFATKFVLIGFRVFIGVDVCFKQVHQYVEYIFFHAWSGSLGGSRLTKYLAQY